MKVTLDTNVLISGTLWKGDSFRILEKIKNNELELFLSEEIINEYEKVLNYEEIIEKINTDKLEIKFTVEKLREMANILIPSKKLDVVREDIDDNIIIECAIEGKVDYIISKDNHLLNLKQFEGIKIVSPEEFLKNPQNHASMS